MKILHIGDVVARIGRRTVQKLLPDLRQEFGIDLVIAQSENMSTGNGVTIKGVQELMNAGVDGFTGGNHSFKKEVFNSYFNDETIPVLRPANYPSDKPGRGSMVLDTTYGKVLVISVESARYNADQTDQAHPLKTIDAILEAHQHEKIAATIVDMHGDLTSDKVATGYYLDGRVSMMVGTHTHVPTADARVLPGGTATITDTGMTGPTGTVLGVDKDVIIGRWLDGKSRRHEVPTSGPATLNAVLVDVDVTTGKARSIEQIIRFTEV